MNFDNGYSKDRILVCQGVIVCVYVFTPPPLLSVAFCALFVKDCQRKGSFVIRFPVST